MKNKILYIGESEILMTMTNPKNNKEVLIEFKNSKKLNMSKKLYELIVKEEKGNGDVTSAVYAYVAQKILLDLADYGFEKIEVISIADALGVLINNLANNKIGEKFDCAGPDRIKLSDLL